MSTYVIKRGSLGEAIEAASVEHLKAFRRAPSTLLLGEECRPDLERELGIHIIGAVGGRYRGMEVVWVPGRQVAVGEFTNLQ